MNHGDGRRVLSPADLRPAIPPSRDLWPGIARAIAATSQDATLDPAAPGAPSVLPRPARRRHGAWTYALGLAATVACLAVGIWIGRASSPAAAPADDPSRLVAAFAPDERYARERQALLVQASLGLARLEPEERRQVEASLATLRQAIADIRRALGEDPGNLLLQEMLVDSYQDEIRVLSAVQAAGATGQEI